MPDGSPSRARRSPINLGAIATTRQLIRQGLEPHARKDAALIAARAFIADLDHPADPEAKRLVSLIDDALRSRT
jgi:hypothetical protein